MRTARLMFILLAGLYCHVFSQDFYDINNVNTIEIYFQESNWDFLLDNMEAAGDEERLLGTAIINETVFDSVGVRYKGNSSFNANQVKNPLNIKLDYVLDDQTIDGYGTLKLANCFKDPTFVRETLSYEIARKYFPASLSNYTNVYINDTYLGLYTNNQDVDKFFSHTHFATDDNIRFKGEIGDHTQPGSMGGVWEYYGTDSTSYFDLFALESDSGWQSLVDFLDTLNNHQEFIDEKLNMDLHLWFLAFQNLLVNLDGPINNPQNHYIFQDISGRFNPIPWDLNEAFGVFTMLQGSGPQDTYQLQHLDPFLNRSNADYPIISSILDDPLYEKIYVAHMKTIMEENFTDGQYLDRALELQQIITDDVQADPNKFYSFSDFTSNLYYSVGGGGQGPGSGSIVGLSQLMETRVTYLQSLLEFQYAPPEITAIEYNPETIMLNSEVRFTVEVVNAQTVYLGYRTAPQAVFERIPFFDDGEHHDGMAGDNIFGLDLEISTTWFEYYVFVENAEAVCFFPPRAEYECFQIPIISPLVINEFLASNDSTNTDEFNEFDDWIELYNRRSDPINLSGYSLTDDLEEPDKWLFPDIVIPGDGFLLIWADNSEDQGNLHTDFKLSAGGEIIGFYNSHGQLLDVISFEDQTADISFGRIDDGAEEWMTFLEPTPGLSNLDPLALDDTSTGPQKFQLFPAYPNPFNPVTNLRYDLSEAALVKITIYDAAGRTIKELKNNYETAGTKIIQWNADNETGSPVSTGLYLVTLQVGCNIQSQKMMVIK